MLLSFPRLLVDTSKGTGGIKSCNCCAQSAKCIRFIFNQLLVKINYNTFNMKVRQILKMTFVKTAWLLCLHGLIKVIQAAMKCDIYYIIKFPLTKTFCWTINSVCQASNALASSGNDRREMRS